MSFAVEQSARASVVFAAPAAGTRGSGPAGGPAPSGASATDVPGACGAPGESGGPSAGRHADSERSAVPVELRYDADAAPQSVSLSFSEMPGGPEHAWVFARDLLERGLRGPAGSGAVRVWPSGRVRAVVELHSDDGVALVQFDSAALTRFLRRTYQDAPTPPTPPTSTTPPAPPATPAAPSAPAAPTAPTGPPIAPTA